MAAGLYASEEVRWFQIDTTGLSGTVLNLKRFKDSVSEWKTTIDVTGEMDIGGDGYLVM